MPQWFLNNLVYHVTCGYKVVECIPQYLPKVKTTLLIKPLYLTVVCSVPETDVRNSATSVGGEASRNRSTHMR